MAAAFLFAAKTARADSGWNQIFPGSYVWSVATNPSNPNQIAAIPDRQLKISLDGGHNWRDSAAPALPYKAVFDSVYPGRIYLATGGGIFLSTDYGQTWQPYGAAATVGGSTGNVVVARDYIYATVGYGLGFPPRLFRFDRQGHFTQLEFPEAPQVMTVNRSNQDLWIGANNGVYRSLDHGSTWQNYEAGFNTRGLVTDGDTVWQTSSQGLFRSIDGTPFKQLTSYTNVKEQFFDDFSTSGLIAYNGSAIFGVASSRLNSFDALMYLAGPNPIRLGLNQEVFDLANGGDHLWAATRNGLWVDGNGEFSNQARVQRPVVIVPGILGSWSVGGRWQLDPILHTYRPLVDELLAHGYIKNQTLFEFPYDWRIDNAETARLLAETIAGIKQICGCSQVDVVAHSMGGLVARSYIEGSNYQNDIKSLVTLGTPNLGAPMAYSIWEAGQTDNFGLKLAMAIMALEAHAAGFTDLPSYIRTSVPSVGQLLPIYNYIENRTYPTEYPSNKFLEVLNLLRNEALLQSRVRVYAIASSRFETLSGLKVERTLAFWPDGNIVTKTNGSGDDTVPIGSATAEGLDLEIDARHENLPTIARADVAAYLLNDYPRAITKSEPATKYLLVYTNAPASLSITDPAGRVVDASHSQISDAFYTGTGANVSFLVINNPLIGHYRIDITPAAAGNYVLGVSLFDPESDAVETSESAATANFGQSNSFGYDLGNTQGSVSAALYSSPSISALPTVVVAGLTDTPHVVVGFLANNISDLKAVVSSPAIAIPQVVVSAVASPVASVKAALSHPILVAETIANPVIDRAWLAIVILATIGALLIIIGTIGQR